MSDQSNKIYSTPEVFKESKWKDTKGKSKRWIVYAMDGKTYGFFHGSTNQQETMLGRMDAGDKFTACYTEKMFNDNLYYELEAVEDVVHDVSKEAQPRLPGAAPADLVNLTDEEIIRKMGCSLAADLVPHMGLEGKGPGEVTAIFLIAAHTISEYIITGKMDVDPSYDDTAPADAEGKADNNGYDGPPPDEGQPVQDPEGEFPPEEEEKEKPRARRTRSTRS